MSLYLYLQDLIRTNYEDDRFHQLAVNLPQLLWTQKRSSVEFLYYPEELNLPVINNSQITLSEEFNFKARSNYGKYYFSLIKYIIYSLKNPDYSIWFWSDYHRRFVHSPFWDFSKLIKEGLKSGYSAFKFEEERLYSGIHSLKITLNELPDRYHAFTIEYHNFPHSCQTRVRAYHPKGFFVEDIYDRRYGEPIQWFMSSFCDRLGRILDSIHIEDNFKQYLGIPNPLICSYYCFASASVKFLRLYDILDIRKEGSDFVVTTSLEHPDFLINPNCSQYKLEFILGVPEVYKNRDLFDQVLNGNIDYTDINSDINIYNSYRTNRESFFHLAYNVNEEPYSFWRIKRNVIEFNVLDKIRGNLEDAAILSSSYLETVPYTYIRWEKEISVPQFSEQE